MASVLLSRILGFFREWTVAHQIGSNAVTDAYYAAFTLPDFLNYLVAAGSLSITFIPVFTQYAAEGREEEGWRAFSTVLTFMGLVLLVLVALGEIFAPRLVSLMAPGFDQTQKARVVFLTRLMLPAQICFYLGGLLSAVQYAQTKFLIPSLAPVVYNVAIILGGLLLSSRIGISGFAVGVLAGALAGNLALQVFGAARAGARFSPKLDFRHPGFRLFIKLSLPIMLALSLVFADDWIIRWFGSYLEPASITWLSYAKTLMRVPLGIVGQAVGVASFPFLARLYSEKKYDELSATLHATLRGLIAVLVPVSALTIVQSRPLVYLVFSHTRLGAPDLEATASTLACFSLGMFAWGVQNILARGFYAIRDTLTPALLGTLITFLNVPVYWLLVRRAQHLGLALASSCGIVAYALILFALLKRKLQSPETRDLALFFLKVSVVSAAGALGGYAILHGLESRVAWQTPWGAFVALVSVTGIGVLITAGLARLLGMGGLRPFLRKLAAP